MHDFQTCNIKIDRSSSIESKIVDNLNEAKSFFAKNRIKKVIDKPKTLTEETQLLQDMNKINQKRFKRLSMVA